MAKGTWENIPYDEQPVFTAHSDGVSDDKRIILVDAAGVSMDIDLTNIAAGTLKINGTDYYTKTKVDELLSALETRVKAWASEQFQPKTS
jgi:hypothetical protein